MDSNPFFTIIVPVYNVESYLSQCLDSILNQKFTDYELIIINDGSTDTSASIITAYQSKHPEIKAIHQDNIGLGAARNAGIRVAKGMYIWFVDSDDTIIENSLSEIFIHLNQENQGHDALFFTHKVLEQNTDNSQTIKNQTGIAADIIDDTYTNIDILTLSLNSQIYPSSCVKIFSRKIILENQIYFTPSAYFEDLSHSITCTFFCKKIKIVKEDFYCYYKRSHSITNSSNDKHIYSIFLVLEQIRQLLIRHNKMQEFHIHYFNLYWAQLIRAFNSHVNEESNDKLKLFLTELYQSRISFDLEQEIKAKTFLKTKIWILLLDHMLTNKSVIDESLQQKVFDSFNIPPALLGKIIVDYMTTKEILNVFEDRLQTLEIRMTTNENNKVTFEERIQKVEQGISIITQIFEDAQDSESSNE